MSINNISPPPIDNDPPPSTEEGKKKLQQFISMSTWGAFKTWLSLQVTAALNQLLTAITFDGNKGLGSINGLPATPGMAQLMGSGQFQTIAGQKSGAIAYNPGPVLFTGSYTFGTATGAYYQVGKLVFVQVNIPINTFTTAGVCGFATPPELPISTTQIALHGRENANAGYALTVVATSQFQFEIFAYNGTNSVTAAGNLLQISGVYYTA